MSRSDRILLAAGGGALVLAIAAAAVLLMPTAGSMSAGEPTLLLTSPLPSGSSAAATAPPPSAIVVDVAGAVLRPGLVELPSGSRIGEAIGAAGGYAPDADLEAAAAINLARVLADGEQVRVPRVGESTPTAAAAPGTGTGTGTRGTPVPAADAGGAPGGGGGGLVDLNTATPEQLEALPGIGAVTVQKIVAARQERPFSSLDDAVQRGVIHRGQLEDIRELATAG